MYSFAAGSAARAARKAMPTYDSPRTLKNVLFLSVPLSLKISFTTSCTPGPSLVSVSHFIAVRFLPSARGNTHPRPDLAPVPADNGFDVALDCLGEFILVPDVRHPRRQRSVPEKCVAVDRLVVRLGPVDKKVGIAEGEGAGRRLGGVPFH